MRGLGKPPRSPTRGRDKPICGAKRRRGSLRRRPLWGNCVLRWGKIFGEVVRGAQFCLKGRTAFEGGGESRRLPRSAQPPAAFSTAERGTPRRCANGGVCRGGRYCGDWESRPNAARLTSPECGTLLRERLPRFATQSAKVAAPSSAAAAAFSMSAAFRNAVPTPLRHALLIYTCGSLRSPPFLTPNWRKF